VIFIEQDLVAVSGAGSADERIIGLRGWGKFETLTRFIYNLQIVRGKNVK
jgi:hypothetical protein